MFFKCKKCGHEVYTEKVMKSCRNLPKTDCPECGEEGYENWIVLGERRI